MINQELLAYVKQQLGRNISKEQIKSSLLPNGWLDSDVEEAFTAVEPHPSMVPPLPPKSPTITPIPNIQPIQPVQPIQPIIQPIQPIQPTVSFIKPAVDKKYFPEEREHKKSNAFRNFIIFSIILIIVAGAGWFVFNKYF